MRGLCEVCGQDGVPLRKSVFEGTNVYACLRCVSQYGLEPPKKKPSIRVRRPRRKRRVRMFKDFPLVEGYGMKVRRARTKRELTQEELAQAIKEKESLVRKIEIEKMRPTPDIVKKLERTLNVKLTSEEVREPEISASKSSQPKGVTLGDIAVFKERKK